MNIQTTQHLSNLQIQDQYLNPNPTKTIQTDSSSQMTFRQMLDARMNRENVTLKFSKHASGRLNDRNIELSQEQLDRLNQGTQKAGAKGIQESLVLVDQFAFIVNVPNATVITAMDQQEAAENVFTNIDGAVIA